MLTGSWGIELRLHAIYKRRERPNLGRGSSPVVGLSDVVALLVLGHCGACLVKPRVEPQQQLIMTLTLGP